MFLHQVTAMGLFIALGIFSEMPTDIITVESKDSKEEVAIKQDDSSARFASKLFSAIDQHDNNNHVFSPFSIRDALGIVALGAKGKTLDEMKKSLEFETSAIDSLPILKLYTPITDDKSDNTLPPIKRSTTIFVHDSTTITEQFCKTIQPLSNVRIESFPKAKENISGLPNCFFEPNTKESECLIFNTLNFSGLWAEPFSSVCHLPFHLNDNKTVPAVFMRETLSVHFKKFDDNFYVFTLPFKKQESSNENFVMIFLVPQKIQEMKSLIKTLTSQNWGDCFNEIMATEKGKIRLFLPRFTIDALVDLKPVLNNLGIKQAFSVEADLSGILKGNALHIRDVIHKVHVEVDEYGVDASAETAVWVGTIGVGKKPLEVKADRPFLYFIYDSTNKQVLFMGQCNNPTIEGTIVPTSEDKIKISERF
ncbi:MAG: serpin family protein [Planctomycetaceae bacterium]|jgi:serpin B|nr:serpin family protein [Planctomycetaceae bacterium]